MVSDIYGRLNYNQLLKIRMYLGIEYVGYSADWDNCIAFTRCSTHGQIYRCPQNARIILKLARIV